MSDFLLGELQALKVDPKAIPPVRPAEVVANSPLTLRIGGDPTGDGDVFDLPILDHASAPVGTQAIALTWAHSVAVLGHLGELGARTWAYLRTRSATTARLFVGPVEPDPDDETAFLWLDTSEIPEFALAEVWIGPEDPAEHVPLGAMWFDTWSGLPSARPAWVPIATPEVVTSDKVRTLVTSGGAILSGALEPVDAQLGDLWLDPTGAVVAQPAPTDDWRYVAHVSTLNQMSGPDIIGGYWWANYTFPGNRPGPGLTSIDATVTPMRDGFPDGWFWCPIQGWGEGHSPSAGIDAGFYVGLQTDGVIGTDRVGGMAIFSMWGAFSASGDELSGSIAQSFGGEGIGYSCRLPYAYKVGDAYRMTMAFNGNRPDGVEWLASILDVKGERTDIIGTIVVPYSHGMIGTNGGQFVERYRRATGSTRDIDTVGESVRMGKPHVNTGLGTLTSTRDVDQPAFATHFGHRVEYDGSISQWVNTAPLSVLTPP